MRRTCSSQSDIRSRVRMRAPGGGATTNGLAGERMFRSYVGTTTARASVAGGASRLGEQSLSGALQPLHATDVLVVQGDQRADLAVELGPDLLEVFVLHGDAVAHELGRAFQ